MHRRDILLNDVLGSTLSTVISNHSNGALHGLLDSSVLVELAKTTPFGELLALISLDKAYVALSTQSLYEFGDLIIIAVLSKYTKLANPLVQGLAALVKSTTKTIVLVGSLKDLLESLNGTELLLSLPE